MITLPASWKTRWTQGFVPNHMLVQIWQRSERCCYRGLQSLMLTRTLQSWRRCWTSTGRQRPGQKHQRPRPLSNLPRRNLRAQNPAPREPPQPRPNPPHPHNRPTPTLGVARSLTMRGAPLPSAAASSDGVAPPLLTAAKTPHVILVAGVEDPL